ncbi:hypothetical protein ANCDUO_21630 [Ancylostoma duodenale]|uniref:Uncharacterized protein n=1 Tax=Ancylostoma duodenale TaxID=51022 RepID=A0A0C2CEP7_9BILA|nr:hypothetical protein ANCDUO_21630 [Ancylostoma duodenale]
MTPRPKIRSGHTGRHYSRYDYEDYYEDRSRSPRPSSLYQRTPSPRKGSKRTLRPHQHREEEHHSSRRLSASRPRKPVRDVSRSPSTDGPYQRTRNRHPRDRDERRDRRERSRTPRARRTRDARPQSVDETPSLLGRSRDFLRGRCVSLGGLGAAVASSSCAGDYEARMDIGI